MALVELAVVDEALDLAPEVERPPLGIGEPAAELPLGAPGDGVGSGGSGGAASASVAQRRSCPCSSSLSIGSERSGMDGVRSAAESSTRSWSAMRWTVEGAKR